MEYASYLYFALLHIRDQIGSNNCIAGSELLQVMGGQKTFSVVCSVLGVDIDVIMLNCHLRPRVCVFL